MTGEHLIEFDSGEVIRPEYDPENNLVGLYVTDDGLDSIHEAVCPDEPRGSSGENGGLEGAIPIDSAVLDIGMAVIEMNAYVPEDIQRE